MNQIPNHIKSKVKDKDWSLDFVFESLPCSHTQGATHYEKSVCERCKYDQREAWLENSLEKQDINEKHQYQDADGKTITATLSKIIVVRGSYDDVIGIEKEFK